MCYERGRGVFPLEEYLAIVHYATNCLSTVSAVYLSFYGLFLVICKTTKGHTSSEYKGLFSIA